MLLSRQPLYNLEKYGAEIGGKKYKIESLDGDKVTISSLFFYKISLIDTSEILEDRDRKLIKSFLSSEAIQVMPFIEPLTLTFQGKSFKLNPSTILKEDMRNKFLLKQGRWLNPERDRFEIVIPYSVASSSIKLPQKITHKIGKNAVDFIIQGVSNQEEGFIDFRSIIPIKRTGKRVSKTR